MTLNGFLVHVLRRLPPACEVHERGGYQFRVGDVDAQRVRSGLVARVVQGVA